MKWKVVVKGDKPSEETVRILTEHTGQTLDSILLTFSSSEEVEFNGFSEGEAQKIADSLKRDSSIKCTILPDTEQKDQAIDLFRVLLVNYRPGYRTRLRRRLQELTRLPQEQIVLWLSKMPFVLSKGIDKDAAKTIKRSITEAGGIVRIETDSMLGERPVRSRRSNAVFRTSSDQTGSASEQEEDPSDILFKRQPAEDALPPVIDLPETFTAGPPPLDEFEDSYGKVVMHPPARFALGLPSVSLDGRFRETPPVLPDISSDSIPEAFEFSPPVIGTGELPPVVGNEGLALFAAGPAPEIVIPFAPPSSIATDLLLPSIIGAEAASLPADLNVHAACGKKNKMQKGKLTASDRTCTDQASEQTALKLFLCPPALNDEDTVAEALREVLGVSLRKSWDLLRKPHSLIETCSDQRRAIRTVRKLESRGVTVALSRGDIPAGVPVGGSADCFTVWLSRNG